MGVFIHHRSFKFLVMLRWVNFAIILREVIFKGIDDGRIIEALCYGWVRKKLFLCVFITRKFTQLITKCVWCEEKEKMCVIWARNYVCEWRRTLATDFFWWEECEIKCWFIVTFLVTIFLMRKRGIPQMRHIFQLISSQWV